MHASHWMQSWKRSTRLLFATRSSTFVGHTATHASQPVQRSSLMSWIRIAGPTTVAGATMPACRFRADSIVNTAIRRIANPPRASGTTQVTTPRIQDLSGRARSVLDVLHQEIPYFGHQVRHVTPLDNDRRPDRDVDALAG